MQGPFLPSILPLLGVKLRCCAQLQKGNVQCPNGAKYGLNVNGEFYFCGVHLKPTSDSVTRMSSPIIHQAKFGDKPTTVVSSVPSVSVPSVVPDLSNIENKEIKQLQQQLQQLQQLFRRQQEVIQFMGKQIESLVKKVYEEDQVVEDQVVEDQAAEDQVAEDQAVEDQVVEDQAE